MKYIHYDGTEIMTGDAIAAAVAEYAAVLGANGRTDMVHVPTADFNGMTTRTALLIGPASQLVVDDAPDDELEPEDPEFVEQLRKASREIAEVDPVHADGTEPFGTDNRDDGAGGGHPSD